MSLDPAFRAASEAAHYWLNTVALVARFGKTRAVDHAYQLLMPTKDRNIHCNLQDEYREHAPVLVRARAALARVSDGPVMWEHGRGRSAVANVPAATFPHVWSSAHEAAEGIARLALDLLACPLADMTDPTEQLALAKRLLSSRWKVIAIPNDEVAILQERIRRERAKVIMEAPPTEVPEWLGDNKVRLVGGRVIELEGNAGFALGALVELGGAATKPNLAKKSGVKDPGRELRKLVRNLPDLAPYITLPVTKGQGGYSTAILDGRPPSETAH